MGHPAIIGAALAVIVLIIVIYIAVKVRTEGPVLAPPHETAGIRGEIEAGKIIRSVLREDDGYFTNVSFTYDNSPAELDNVIVNKSGVFVIEVKNYSGRLYGAEDDFEWLKVRTSAAGNRFEKTVKNPIRQVKRQAGLLHKYLDYYGVRVWVNGYALILDAAWEGKSDILLESADDIGRAIHTPGKTRLNAKKTEAIIKLLSE